MNRVERPDWVAREWLPSSVYDLGADAAPVDQGKTYFKIHTSDFPGGEIRGVLVKP